MNDYSEVSLEPQSYRFSKLYEIEIYLGETEESERLAKKYETISLPYNNY